jgi:hypothetical protein
LALDASNTALGIAFLLILIKYLTFDNILCYAPACFSWEERLKTPTPRHGEGTSVQVDWIGWLPEAKMHAFRVYAEEFEARYLMLSISLNEAIGLHKSGSDRKSYQIVLITPALCERLADPLEGMLCSLEEHVRRNKMVPSVCPLDAANFQGLRGQRSARKSSLLSNALLSQRAQYLSKGRYAARDAELYER